MENVHRHLRLFPKLLSNESALSLGLPNEAPKLNYSSASVMRRERGPKIRPCVTSAPSWLMDEGEEPFMYYYCREPGPWRRYRQRGTKRGDANPVNNNHCWACKSPYVAGISIYEGLCWKMPLTELRLGLVAQIICIFLQTLIGSIILTGFSGFFHLLRFQTSQADLMFRL